MTEDKEDVISPEVIEIQMKDVKVCHFAMFFLLLSYFASEVSEAVMAIIQTNTIIYF